MQRASLKLRLADDIVLSARGATTGGHSSLDYLPGAALLGAAASRLYASLSREDSFIAFHSGKLRFLDALPLAPSGATTRPAPLCWHEKKDHSAIHNNMLDGRLVFNLSLADIDVGFQPKQLRDGYVSDHGEIVRPQRTFRMKTAIEEDRNRAVAGQLFGYECLSAGLLLCSAIEADDDVDPGLMEKIAKSLAGSILIGRSRSAQYGRVEVTRGKRVELPAATAVTGDSLTLWLVSDLAALNANGEPTFAPRLSDLHPELPKEIELNPRSFIRVRRYSPYNGARRLPDLERQVIQHGSVLCYNIAALSARHRELLATALAAGVGAYRECGLGQVSVNSPLLTAQSLAFVKLSTETKKAEVSDQVALDPRHGPLARWLEQSANFRTARVELKEWAQRKSKELFLLYRNAQRLAGLRELELAGPSRSQWGAVEAAGKRHRDAAQLMHALFDPSSGVCRVRTHGPEREGGPAATERNEDWSQTGTLKGEAKRFHQWLREALTEPQTKGVSGVAAALLADAAKKMLAAEGRKKALRNDAPRSSGARS